MSGIFSKRTPKVCCNPHILCLHSGSPVFLTQQDGSGTITIKEFEKGFHVETTKALFEALGLKAEDAWTLFRSLDKDGGHTQAPPFSCQSG